LGTGLAVPGRVRDIGHNVSKLIFNQEVELAPTYFHIFFLIAFPEEVFSEI
jgi:hypothetical protein